MDFLDLLGYRPGLPWENFFRQDAHDGSSDSMDTDETDNDYLVADDASKFNSIDKLTYYK